jgi:hypothetical protein
LTVSPVVPHPLCHATPARRVIPLLVAANFWDSESVSSADCSTLWLDAGPHATSSVLWHFSLQPLL